MHIFPAVLASTAIVIAVACAGMQPASAAQPAEKPRAAPLDLTTTAEYISGRWEYRFTVTAPGSKNEGYRGELFFDGKPVEEPSDDGDFYRTPWGDVSWRGDPVTPAGEHGWMPREKGATGGRAIVEPWRASGAPIVMMMVLVPGPNAPKQPRIQVDRWIETELSKLGAKEFKVQREWFPLTDQAFVLHETKIYGTLTARQAQPRDDASLAVLLDGSDSSRIELPRRAGATLLVRHTMRSNLESLDLYLALKVEHAAPAWPRPLEVGPESNGKVVTVRGAHEVVLALPGDLASGKAWIVESIGGDSPHGGAAKVAGAPQFVAGPPTKTSARPGTFETLLRVAELGTCDVVLAYRDPRQEDAPPEQTFRVTLKVVELAPRQPGRWPDVAK